MLKIRFEALKTTKNGQVLHQAFARSNSYLNLI